MLSWRIGAIALLSLSIAACSSQDVRPEGAGNAPESSYVQPQAQNQHYRASPPRHGAANHNRHGNQPAAAPPPTSPTALRPMGGDTAYHGGAQLTRLPDNVAYTLSQHGFSEQGMGAYVRPANGAQPLLASYSDIPRNPASTMKLVTSYAALGVLGPNYRWPTEIYTSGNLAGDTLQGDVIVKGYGNPDFRIEDFRQLLQALRAHGIRNIAGNFVIDKSYFSVANQGVIDGNVDADYNAEPEALLYNERGSCYEVRNKAGQVQRVCPVLPHDGKTMANLNVNLFGDFWKIWVGEMHGQLGGTLQVSQLPGNAQLVSTQYSNPLSQILMTINKDSNNVMARQVLLSMGAKQFGAPGTAQKGASAVGQFLESRGLHLSSLRIENGCGLSRVERISAHDMGDMLVDAYNSPYRDALMSSMAVAGVDGTVKNRMKNIAGRGKFKTGTLRDTRALAGYLMAANGQTYVISILHNDPRINGSAKEAHEALVDWVYFGGRNNVASAM